MGKVSKRRIQNVYVGSRREEERLAGIVGLIGSAMEVLDLGYGSISDRDRPDFITSRRAFYYVHADHPGHPMWRPQPGQIPEAACPLYYKLIHKAVREWKADNPNTFAVHPKSVDWNPEWDDLEFDPDKVYPHRKKFLLANITALREAGLRKLLQKQVDDFMRHYYEPIEHAD